MSRVLSKVIVVAVLSVTLTATAQEKTRERSDLDPFVLSKAKQQLHEKIVVLESELKRAEESGSAYRKNDLELMIKQVKSELAKIEAAQQAAGDLGAEQMSNVSEQMRQFREQISALTKEYVTAVNESTESVADNARVKELTVKLNELQANLSALENSHPGMGFGGYRGSDLQMGRMRRDRGMGGDMVRGGGLGFMGGAPAMPGAVENLSTPVQSQLEGQVTLLARQLAQSDTDTQASVDKALRKVLGELYDHRVLQREDQLKQLEKRVADLRAQLDRQRQAKDEVIDLRVKTMINEAKGLGFLGQPGTSSSQIEFRP